LTAEQSLKAVASFTAKAFRVVLESKSNFKIKLLISKSLSLTAISDARIIRVSFHGKRETRKDGRRGDGKYGFD
jgi:hypothetical protein